MSGNDYWTAMLGYPLEEVDDATADGWLALIHPDDQQRVRQALDDHLAGRTPLYEVEYRMQARDGSDRWILDQARIVSRDGAGRPRRLSGTHEDITSRKLAQRVLEDAHQRLTTILNAMGAQAGGAPASIGRRGTLPRGRTGHAKRWRGGISACETPDRWLQRVDEALYAAKTAGRNRVSLHQSGIAE